MRVLKWGAIAFVTALAVWVFWHDSASAPRLAPPEPAAMQPSKVALPETLVNASVTTSAASKPQVSSPKTGETIGSEGYGPHIERIAASGTPAEAMAAMRWLQSCDNNERLINNAQKQRAVHGERGGLYKDILEKAEANGRRCQTVTPEIRALMPDLGVKSLNGGIEGAASAYLGIVHSDPPTELRALLIQQLQADAQAGDLASLLKLGGPRNQLGLSAADRVNYVAALTQFPSLAPLANVISKQLAAESPPPPDPAVVKAIVDAINARHGPEVGTINSPTSLPGRLTDVADRP